MTLHSFDDLLRALREHPEWREQLRRQVLTDELLAPARGAVAGEWIHARALERGRELGVRAVLDGLALPQPDFPAP